MLGRRNVFLIGPMGSGKTAVGKALARLLGVPFYDSDREIERRTGVDIPFIFEKEGEAGFREREREVIDDLTRQEPLVLATGGGAILHAENRQNLAARGCVVYLQTSVHNLVSRVKRSQNRPLLHNTDPGEKLQQLMRDRGPLYAETADVTVATDNRRVRSVAEQIARILAGGENTRS
jgi:shikimate kinase